MTQPDTDNEFLRHLERIANALEKFSPTDPKAEDMEPGSAYVWNRATRRLNVVHKINRIDLRLLCGVDYQRDNLLSNTIAFVRGFAANNALLWGARGTGKSSLIKAVHGTVTERGMDCALVEVHREDIDDLPFLMSYLSRIDRRFIVFTDDLTFDHGDSSYKSLKAALDGGVEGRPENVLLYATSNRRHLMPRDMIENERSTAINPSEATEEKVSLSDRFGLWLGFHKCSQDDYLAMIDGYAAHFGLEGGKDALHAEALTWATTRGGRSGRVAWQFIQDIAGRQRRHLGG